MTRTTSRILLTTALALGLGAGSSSAIPISGGLYAVNWDDAAGGSAGVGTALYTMDTSTAVATNVGTLSGDHSHATSIAFNSSGALFGINWNGSSAGVGTALQSIDPLTALTTTIASLAGDQTNATSIAFDVGGTLFGIDWNVPAFGVAAGTTLFTIDPLTAVTTNVATLSGDRSHATSIAFSSDGTLYGVNWDGTSDVGVGSALFTIDPLTGLTTDAATLSGRLATSIGFDASGALFGINYDGNGGAGVGTILYTIDPLTGVTTDVASISGGPGRTHASSIAFAPVPEPGTLLLLGAGFSGLALLGRKRV